MAENVGKRLEQKESKQKKTKKPSRLTKRQKWLLAVAIVLAVVLVAVVALDGLFVKPELPGKGNGSNADGTQAGEKPLRREGYRDGTWVLLDYGCICVHVFSAEARSFYDLERLWADGKPLDLTGVLTQD